MEINGSQTSCPICGNELGLVWDAHTKVVCKTCEERAVDAMHNPVVVTRQVIRIDNALQLAGLVAYDRARGEFDVEKATVNRDVTRSRCCFIDGITVEFVEDGLFTGLKVSEDQEALTKDVLGSKQTQPCGICKKPVSYYARYPKYVCYPCQERAVDSLHRPVVTANTELLGYGQIAYLRDRPEGTTDDVPSDPANENYEIFIDGILCTFEEARFGGIVVQVGRKEERKPFNG